MLHTLLAEATNTGEDARWELIVRADMLSYRQIRQGINNSTKGTIFVVYEDVVDAKAACDKLNGFNFQGRYLVGRHARAALVQFNLR